MDLRRAFAIVGTPLLFGFVFYHPAVPSAGTYPERFIPGVLFGIVVLAVGLYVEPDADGGGE
jgi:hypothetical protein